MKTLAVLFVALLLGCAIYVYASGGSGGGGGGGCGKHCNTGGGTTSTPPDWQKSSLFENWVYAHTAVNTSCGTYFPMSYVSNSCPNNFSQSIYDNSYYGNIVVEDLEVSNSRFTFCRNGFYTEIQVPYNHRYRITFDFVEHCSTCVSPNLIYLPAFEGRRIHWQARKEYPRFSISPQVDFFFLGLDHC